ncbi:type II secretion system protein [Shewanella gelidimarina]|uniref:type II secretion system protein n=1 Tax=Shewanella gelidimarina TaxID=56813 RepID=UPI0024B1A1C1|nr:prepilin-type N-terminal cleavage/methylation domain-containing protein [Shewanella gelidimarina]
MAINISIFTQSSIKGQMKYGNKNGFTLIELVVVIIILGVLAVVAAPNFINLKSDAVLANMETLEGTLKSTNQLVYSKAVLEGQEKLEQGSIVNNGTTIMTSFGYVAATSTNIPNAIEGSFEAITFADDSFEADWGLLPLAGFAVVFLPKGYSIADNCLLLYAVLPASNDPLFYLPLTSDC